MAIPKVVLAGIEDTFKFHAEGKGGGRIFCVARFSPEKLRALRTETLMMSQREFAVQFGIPIRTLQKWEQGEREPEGPARAYLEVIARIPDAVMRALHIAVDENVLEDVT